MKPARYTAVLAIALAFFPCCNRSGAAAGVGKSKPPGPAAASVNTVTGEVCLSSTKGEGIRYAESSASDKVMNGSAYDCSALRIKGISKIVVPSDAEVESGLAENVIVIRMRKSLAFMGHPPKMVTPYVARWNMGCAWKVDGETLLLGTYGEWDSHIEGGASMRLAITAPPGLPVEKREGLSGESSSADPPASVTEDDQWYWYGPVAPGAGWEKIESSPDPASAAADDKKQSEKKQGGAGG
jgi:hypothetical protein